MGFAKIGADGSNVSTFCFSIGLHIQQDYYGSTKSFFNFFFRVINMLSGSYSHKVFCYSLPILR